MESHSPGGGKHRGNASQLFERYSILARDAQSAGDRVACEGFLQYAEHYLRILNAAQPNRGNGRPQGNGQDGKLEVVQGDGGDGGDGRQAEPRLDDSGDPAPETPKSPPEDVPEAENSLEEIEKDPLEPEPAVN